MRLLWEGWLMMTDDNPYDELAEAQALWESEVRESRLIGEEIARLQRMQSLATDRIRTAHCGVVEAEARIRNGELDALYA